MDGLGRFLRLRSAIDTVLADASDKAFAAPALTDAYIRMRTEARTLAEAAGVVDEFDRLNPTLASTPVPSHRSGFDPIKFQADAHVAATHLRTLSGWLNGFILEDERDRGSAN